MKSHITAAVVPRFNLLKNHFLFIIVSPFSTTKSPRQAQVDGGLCRQKLIYELRRRREGILVVSHRNRVRKTTCFSIWTGGDLNSKPTWKS
ncbi:hypothetical protein P8452_55779 [Trifolium repens]|nr:hypothetical protein P8452_55779 [Trifolium repens]